MSHLDHPPVFFSVSRGSLSLSLSPAALAVLEPSSIFVDHLNRFIYEHSSVSPVLRIALEEEMRLLRSLTTLSK